MLGECRVLAEEAKGHVGAVLTVPTLEYLYRGGRIGGAARLVGTMLNIKPILEVRGGHRAAGKDAHPQAAGGHRSWTAIGARTGMRGHLPRPCRTQRPPATGANRRPAPYPVSPHPPLSRRRSRGARHHGADLLDRFLARYPVTFWRLEGYPLVSTPSALPYWVTPPSIVHRGDLCRSPRWIFQGAC